MEQRGRNTLTRAEGPPALTGTGLAARGTQVSTQQQGAGFAAVVGRGLRRQPLTLPHRPRGRNASVRSDVHAGSSREQKRDKPGFGWWGQPDTGLSRALTADGDLPSTWDSKVNPSPRVPASLMPPLSRDAASWGSGTSHLHPLLEGPQDLAWLTAERATGRDARTQAHRLQVLLCSPGLGVQRGGEPRDEGAHLTGLLRGKVARDLGGGGHTGRAGGEGVEFKSANAGI